MRLLPPLAKLKNIALLARLLRFEFRFDGHTHANRAKGDARELQRVDQGKRILGQGVHVQIAGAAAQPLPSVVVDQYLEVLVQLFDQRLKHPPVKEQRMAQHQNRLAGLGVTLEMQADVVHHQVRHGRMLRSANQTLMLEDVTREDSPPCWGI